MALSTVSGLSWKWLVGGALSSFLAYANLPSRWLMPQEAATGSYLATANLLALPSGDSVASTKALWHEHGAVVMAVRRPGWQLCRDEALALSKLEPELTRLNVPLLAVLHEKLGSEEFQEFFKGPLFLDTDQTFFGPKKRKLFLMGFLRVDTWLNVYRSKQAGTQGNLDGDGTLLGAVYVLGPGDQGVVYEHREGTFGDDVNTNEVLQAVQQFKKNN